MVGGCLMGVYLTGVHLMGMYLTGVHLLGVGFTGMYLIPCKGNTSCSLGGL
jgi:hypothetical protein